MTDDELIKRMMEIGRFFECTDCSALFGSPTAVCPYCGETSLTEFSKEDFFKLCESRHPQYEYCQ